MFFSFSPSWVSCLNKSMSIWFNRWICPGWMIIRQKPHPFGNEYHTSCCGKSGILFGMEMVEGKDELREIGVGEENEKGATTGLL